jgi:hypothetical protein
MADLPPVAYNCQALLSGSGPVSEWARPGRPGEPALTYKPINAAGDRMMDFSHAGYLGGGVALPSPAVVQSLAPSGGDDTTAIQAAIDAVAGRAPSEGFRGAVLLKPGTFQVAGQIRITASGVVLRGSGSGPGGTELRFTGAPRRVMFVTGTGNRTLDTNMASIVDDYVPAGARSFRLNSAAGFAWATR